MTQPKKKNVNINANNVQVSRNRKKRPKKQRGQQNGLKVPAELESGMVTRNDVSSYGGIENSGQIRSSRSTINVDPNSLGWFFKYLDPAGATETCRAIGEYSKIPDGLLKYSVDAEPRCLFNEFCPVLSNETNIPLDGKLWSIVIISVPCYRTAYIAVANNLNEEVSSTVVSALCQTLNNLTNWRSVVDDDVWVPFVDGNENWFYRIRVFPPTYAIEDPSLTTTRTVTAYRMSYKALTAEFNAPTLVDQGFWAGGHYAMTPIISEQNPATSSAHVGVLEISRSGAAAASFNFVGLPRGGTSLATGNPDWVQIDTNWFGWRHGGTVVPNGPVSYEIPAAYTLASISGAENIPFAVPFDVITVAQIAPNTFELTNTTNDTIVPITISVSSGTVATYFSITGSIQSSNRISTFLPPLTMSQVVANNPKMEQFVAKDSKGAYIVHSKMNNPVFGVTSADSFGGLAFKDSYYDDNLNISAPLGIRDSHDLNFSTAVVVMRGLSSSATIVIKGYMGWEGVTAVNTPMGQFAHSGLERNTEILDLADTLAGTKLTGIYPARDNFAGAVAAFGAQALASLLSCEATQAKIREVADLAENHAMNYIKDKTSRPTSLLGRMGRGILNVGGRILSRLLGVR